MPTAASGAPITGMPGMNGFGTIVQRFLEMSNVKVVEEMVNLIVAQRAYEINSKAIQTADEMLSIANNLRR
jgi:flagellar basal-body rod protein FlgG